MVNDNFISVTEIAGEGITKEQIERLCNRYYWAGNYCKDKDVVEVACGTGPGLGYLKNFANSIEAGDYSSKIFLIAKQHYGNRIKLSQFDAQDMPFDNVSKDVIILFEAIYYIPDVEKFIKECLRVLRPKGTVLIATANKDLYDFNPSPNSYRYFNVVELRNMFKKHGFKTEFFGNTPMNEVSTLQKVLRPIKKIAVSLNLMPKTMAAKKIFKRIVFGKLVTMPHEIDKNTSVYVTPTPLSPNSPDKRHKVIYCTAILDG